MAAVDGVALVHHHSEKLGSRAFLDTGCSASFLRLGRQVRLQV